MLKLNFKTITYFLIALTSLPWLFLVPLPSQSLISAAAYTSSVAGFVGVVLLLWQLILGTRAITGLFYKDLSWTIKVHSWLGKYGTLLIFAHPLLVTYSYSQSLLYTFVPDFSNNFEVYVTLGRLALYVFLVVWFTSAIIRGKIKYRPWKYLHYLAYASIPFALLHAPEVGSSFGEYLVDAYWYGLVGLFILFVGARIIFSLGAGRLKYGVVGHRQVAEETFELTLEPLNNHFIVTPGQYLYIQPDILSEEHPFSVAGYNPDSGNLTVTYKVFGSFTKRLSEMPIGKKVRVDGPYGVFTKEVFESPDSPVVFMAGGIGVTPFLSHLSQAEDMPRYTLFVAARHAGCSAYASELKRLLGPKFIEVFNEPQQELLPGQESGFINADLVAKYVSEPQANNYFICGPKPMMTAVTKCLLDMGVPKSSIHTEEFSF